MNLRQKLLVAAVLSALAAPAFATRPSDEVIVRAQAALQARPALALASAEDRFAARDAIVDADGTEHVRFDRSYAGMR